MNLKLFWLITAILLAFLDGAEAQQAKRVPRIGFLSSQSASRSANRAAAFRTGFVVHCILALLAITPS